MSLGPKKTIDYTSLANQERETWIQTDKSWPEQYEHHTTNRAELESYLRKRSLLLGQQFEMRKKDLKCWAQVQSKPSSSSLIHILTYLWILFKKSLKIELIELDPKAWVLCLFEPIKIKGTPLTELTKTEGPPIGWTDQDWRPPY